LNNKRYLAYALVVTAIITWVNWSGMVSFARDSGGYLNAFSRSHGSSGSGSWGGGSGGHK